MFIIQEKKWSRLYFHVILASSSKICTLNTNDRNASKFLNQILGLQYLLKYMQRSTSPQVFCRLVESSSFAVPWSGWESPSLWSLGHQYWTFALPLVVLYETYLDKWEDTPQWCLTYSTSNPLIAFGVWFHALVVLQSASYCCICDCRMI